jgi:hypothetical protein
MLVDEELLLQTALIVFKLQLAVVPGSEKHFQFSWARYCKIYSLFCFAWER